MVRRRKSIKRLPRKPQKKWYLDLAFGLGKTAHQVSQKVGAAAVASAKDLSAARDSFAKGLRKKTRSGKNRIRIIPAASSKPVSPVQKELRGIADVSGLTDAIREMNEINLRHASHPVVQRWLLKLMALSPAEQEMLSRKFIDRLSVNPSFSQVMGTFPAGSKMTEEDARKMSDAFIECSFQALEDMGFPPEEQKLLRDISDEVMQPLNDLIQFYLKPKTFSQKMKRLWRIQRVFVKMVKLFHLTRTLVSEAERPAPVIPAVSNECSPPEMISR